MKQFGSTGAFVAASVSLIAIYAASATPIPLYGLYRTADGLSYTELSLSSVVYFVGAVSSLLFLGRLSNHFGRKISAFLTLALMAVAALCFLNVHSATPLLIGRFLQGLSCGMASTALAAWVVDNAPARPSWIAPAILSCGPMTGLTIGGIISGTLVEFGSDPRVLPYLVITGVLAACVFLCFNSPETVNRKPGALSSLKPQIGLPLPARRAFRIGVFTFVPTWALGGFYQAFGPAMAMEYLHASSALAAALVFASTMAPSPIGASLAGRTSAANAQRIGMVAFALSVGTVVLTLSQGLLVPFLIASICAGISQGSVLSSSIQSVMSKVTLEQRANVLGLIYATSYTGAAVPTLIAGRLSESYSLVQVLVGYAGMATIGCIAVLLFVRNTGADSSKAS
ncbi:MFS transporter [Marinobacter salinexigens]|uniref:MFS transporter n=1 Tax=Marinobacter salinexigens TaxID=2919747 RepID=UPI001CB6E5E2|nr:MFS transporter [Marinobacter salinexigens]